MDTEGYLISQDLQEYNVLTPKPLYAEQRQGVWLDATKTAIKNAVHKAGIAAENIRGIATSGLMGALRNIMNITKFINLSIKIKV